MVYNNSDMFVNWHAWNYMNARSVQTALLLSSCRYFVAYLVIDINMGCDVDLNCRFHINYQLIKKKISN